MSVVNAKENLLRAIRRNHPRWVPNALEARVRIKPPLDERPTKEGRDAFGVPWSFQEDAEGGTYPTVGGHTISDVHRWRQQLALPDVSRLDWSETRRQARQVDRSQFLLEGFVEMGLFERSYLLLGMEQALMAFLTEPREMSAMLSAIADYKIALIRAFHEAAHPDMIWYGDDWGTQSNLFLPPEVWRAVVKPQTQRIYDCMGSLGIIVNQHSCGKIEAVFGDMVEMGPSLWNPCQPCNDLAALKRRYGSRISFNGGIDSQFVLARPGVTTEEVRAEVRLRIDQLASGGGYVATPSHGVPYAPEIVQAMNEEIETYGRAFYERNP